MKANSLRSHDKFTRGKNYQLNINSRETNKLGDLCTYAGHSSGPECPFWHGERNHVFKSDEHGFKTIENFQDSNIIMIGDSFLAATGGDNTDEQLGSIISSNTNHKIYEAAHPGDIDVYIERYNYLKDLHNGTSKKYIFVLFEGNDFYGTLTNNKEAAETKKPWHLLRPLYSPLVNAIKNTALNKLIMTYTAHRTLSKENVVSRTINNRLQAFSKDYINISKQDLALRQDQLEYFINEKESICAIIVIPTASSVYLLEDQFEKRHPTLTQQLRQINEANIPIINLTQALKDAASEEILGNSIWWSDDTHWNKNGISIASDVIIKSNLNCLANPY